MLIKKQANAHSPWTQFMKWWGHKEPQRKWLFPNKELMHFKLLSTWTWNESMLLLLNTVAQWFWQQDWQFEGLFTKSYSMLNFGNEFFPFPGKTTKKKPKWPDLYRCASGWMAKAWLLNLLVLIYYFLVFALHLTNTKHWIHTLS